MVIEVEPDYQELIDLVADKDLDLDISNSSINHTKYVLTKIIEKTKNKVNIFSDILSKELYFNSDVIKSFKENNKIEINILLNKSNKKDIDNFKKWVTNKKIDVRQIKKIGERSYFIVSDGKRVRIESHDKPNEARVNFNKKLLGEKLNNFFDSLWKSASPIK